ncbi:TMV resistance protein N-like [Cynara cardunculus var. scolymus]|uniref:TMV resistance protein N-like n=1 Tax=Cynara cardunculus var. scolymus TaxID=59895 RepID=UPI000D62EE59|nr:TMV resistance protein N-like [Cynara cardunculus var. scolymus]
MASSSSSSQLWKHDVFLSFRGKDTRNTFVDHLYSALVQQGIYPYKDDEALPRGETISPSLLKAIEESRIAVIVFSKNYANSSWCLEELAHIMKCKNERGQIVIPIFYHIDPSELRNQKRKYGEALAKHESKKKIVESWRKALADAGNLSGDVVNGPETIFIKGIVDTISERLCVAISSDSEDLIGIEARLQDLKSKLAMDSRDVLLVGIWGLGGGGKTTLASALYDEISSKFDGSCFVKDIREESRKHGLPKLQKEILSLVLKQKREEVVGDVGSLIKSRFRRKKVLMVLDDVDHAGQLKELAGSNAWFGKGSRIIITTRDNHLLNAHKVNVIYNISLLNDDEAIKLFYKHAPPDHRPIEDYEMLSKDVVSYASGLPLALKVLGSFLCDKDMSEWMSALARLKEIPDGDIVEKLKISYDGLKPMEKELFLDIACFFRGKKKDKAMVILDACGFHPIIGVKVLIQKALITVSQARRFDMHDLIQEMGYYIVQEENPKNPEKHSRVWQTEDVLKICAVDAMVVMLELALYIMLYRQRGKGSYIPPSFPQVVGNMKKLRWISCYGYSATSLPREFQPMELCCLKLEWSLVEQLWDGYKHLPNLKVLDLTKSRNLVSTPDFDGLPCLERLMLRSCTSLKEMHPSIGCHERLIFLDMEYCESLEIFPPIIRVKRLETLILSCCYKLCKFPEIETSMDNLVELSLRGSQIEILPSSIGEYCTNLLSLDLRECRYLWSIEGNFHPLKHLKGLYLRGCEELKNIPEEGLFDKECCLQVLSSFKNLHLGMVSMKLFGISSSLRMLDLRDCNLVDGDVSSVFCNELSNLQALDLGGNYFSQLHSSLLQLPCLKFLDLSDCLNLVELPDLPSSIAILIASNCNSLNIVGDFPTNNLKWLWKVSLPTHSMSGDGERVVQSMLQGNAIEDYFLSIKFDDAYIPIQGCEWGTFTLQLPWNWYSEYSGFLVYVEYWIPYMHEVITIDDVVGRENEGDVLEVSNEDEESEKTSGMCYISFVSLRDTSWWNSCHNAISFSINYDTLLKVELVPKRSQDDDDSVKKAKDTTYLSKFWDKEEDKTFEIISDSSSSISISWLHNHYVDMFHHV